MPSPMQRAELFVNEGRLGDLERLRDGLVQVNDDSVSMYERTQEVIDFANEHLPGADEPSPPPEKKEAAKKNGKKAKKKTKKG